MRRRPGVRFPGSTLYALEPLPEHFARAELYKPTSLDSLRCVNYSIFGIIGFRSKSLMTIANSISSTELI
ncbi:hypothetical protein GFJ88_14310, partial [Salmonella enterica subsp. enterica serovar Enteritidis]|nr:hypothetical protein [Salmonella enterica subsp. enterica serovar Enteritidis]